MRGVQDVLPLRVQPSAGSRSRVHVEMRGGCTLALGARTLSASVLGARTLSASVLRARTLSAASGALGLVSITMAPEFVALTLLC